MYREPREVREGRAETLPYRCPVCGSNDFTLGPVPAEWDEIFENLDPAEGELETLHRREHLSCDRCHANLRGMALAKAILAAERWPVARDARIFNLCTLLATRPWLRLLEVNEAHVVGSLLRRLPGHVAADYPEVDVEALPFDDRSFRLVVHSDTLEHVPHPLTALRECFRVLRPGGSMVFTVPIRPALATVNREGLPPVYHGDSKPPFRSLVHTDFGADLWTKVLEAGFTELTIVTIESPAGLSYWARRPHATGQ